MWTLRAVGGPPWHGPRSTLMRRFSLIFSTYATTTKNSVGCAFVVLVTPVAWLKFPLGHREQHNLDSISRELLHFTKCQLRPIILRWRRGRRDIANGESVPHSIPLFNWLVKYKGENSASCRFFEREWGVCSSTWLWIYGMRHHLKIYPRCCVIMGPILTFPTKKEIHRCICRRINFYGFRTIKLFPLALAHGVMSP